MPHWILQRLRPHLIVLASTVLENLVIHATNRDSEDSPLRFKLPELDHKAQEIVSSEFDDKPTLSL